MNRESRGKPVGQKKRRILLLIGSALLIAGSLVVSPVQAEGDQAVIQSGSEPATTAETPAAAANQRPTGNDTTTSTTVNTPVSGVIDATDPDGDKLWHYACCQPEHGTVEVTVDGNWTYTPHQDYTGWDIFKVRVYDGISGSVVVQVKILVHPANRPPSGEDEVVKTVMHQPVSGQVKSGDPDGDPLTHTLVSGPLDGTAVVNADGTYTFTPAWEFQGTALFFVKISDGRGGETQVSVTVNVQDNAIVKEISMLQDTSLEVMQYIGGEYSTHIDVNPQHGTLSLGPISESWTYTPNKGFVGQDTFTIHFVTRQGPPGPEYRKKLIINVMPKTPPELPKTGSPLDRNLLYGAGALLMGIGGWLRFRRKRT